VGNSGYVARVGSLPNAQSDTWARRARQRLCQAMREFAAVPLLIIVLFLILASVSIVFDQSHAGDFRSLRHILEHFVGTDAATNTLQAIATGLVTVTSITFSMLLLAVQQTASTLSPVVFDQFMRRRSNQVYFGFFLGLTLYSYVVLVAVDKDTPPVLGASLATLLTAGALICLLLLVYSTVDQMRPANVLRQIHDRTLLGRRREADLIGRTRRVEQSRSSVSATYFAKTTGYVVGVDLPRLERALRAVPGAEIKLWVPVGHAVAYGDKLATVRDDDADRARRLADEIRGAVLIAAEPDLDVSAGTGLAEIGNIAWTSASTAKHNPEITQRAVHVLRDLIARWLDDGEVAARGEPLAVVYPDNDLDHAFDVLYAILGAAHESKQHMTAADVLAAYRRLAAHADEPIRERLRSDLAVGLRLVEQMPPAPILQQEVCRMRAAGLLGLEEAVAGHDSR
jgi:uncharacterized membrane protein